MVDMRVELAGLELANPVLLASGILDSTPGILARMADAGAGALVTKSISLKPRPGYAGPTVAEVGLGTWLNAIGSVSYTHPTRWTKEHVQTPGCAGTFY